MSSMTKKELANSLKKLMSKKPLGKITVKDVVMDCGVNRQPHFKEQPEDQLVVWVYGLLINEPGNYVKKPMKECTGVEITEEWLYHMGVPEDQIHDLAVNSASCIPCMMPYITAFFAPRTQGDRPQVVPDGCTNFAFLGQFADTVRDVVFTTEYSVRTAMEAVYTLLNIDRGVPEVFNSCYDIRVLLDSTHKMMDGKKLTELDLPPAVVEKIMPIMPIMPLISKTVIGDLLVRYGLI